MALRSYKSNIGIAILYILGVLKQTVVQRPFDTAPPKDALKPPESAKSGAEPMGGMALPMRMPLHGPLARFRV